MILIRCDASSSLGVGHLARCRTLAAALRDAGQQCVLVGPPMEFKLDSDDETFRDWVPMPFDASPRADATRLAALLADRNAHFAILDDYRIDADYQAELLQASVRWLQFNRDPAQPLWADLILNPSPEPTDADYRGAIRKPGARLLLGPKYAILRPEFDLDDRVADRGGKTRILVTFGGGDDRAAIVTTLRTVLPELPRNVRFLVISGRHNPANPAIAAWIAAHGRDRVDLVVDPPSVAPLIASCDLAIMAGGGTVFEVNRYRIPMVLIALADNQVDHSRAWERLGAARYLGRVETLDPRDLVSAAKRAIAPAAEDDDKSAVPRLVDGQGRNRVAKAIVETMRS